MRKKGERALRSNNMLEGKTGGKQEDRENLPVYKIKTKLYNRRGQTIINPGDLTTKQEFIYSLIQQIFIVIQSTYSVETVFQALGMNQWTRQTKISVVLKLIFQHSCTK